MSDSSFFLSHVLFVSRGTLPLLSAVSVPVCHHPHVVCQSTVWSVSDQLQAMLRLFIRAQMAYHARSLEILTEADEHINTMGPERDIQV